MKKKFRTTAKIALVLIYLVIIAGAVVRMTGSGMGCPDWPKCFGYYIPPTQIEDLQFKPNHDYKKGVVIIVDEKLQVAKKTFTSSDLLDLNNWEPYTAHDYAIFNPLHTWVEYINRLLGALSGIPILIFTIMSVWLWKDRKRYFILSFITVLAMAFQAWLGKTVVDSNLAPYKITIHMVMALVIVGLILYLIYLTKPFNSKFKDDHWFRVLIYMATALTLGQIILGTQVRQFVDEQNKILGYLNWDFQDLAPFKFYVHRSVSILVVILNGLLFYRNRKYLLGYSKINWVMLLIGLEILTGVAMYYFNFPFSSQPLHLVIAALLIGVQFYLVLESRSVKKKSLNA